MAGFAVGVVEESEIISGKDIEPGDVVIGIGSSGVHSNGFSLVRKLFFERMGLGVNDYIDELGETLGKSLLTPTRIYVKSMLDLFGKVKVKGAVHMTGGGFYENIPRILQKGLSAEIDLNAWTPLPIFNYMKEKGDISVEDMFGTFNMGIGFIVVVSPEDQEATIRSLESNGESCFVIGSIVKGDEGIVLCQK
jgi:phosphoribosylformylglycinamidine cyclo-ligase